jgi:hypothetical protein
LEGNDVHRIDDFNQFGRLKKCEAGGILRETKALYVRNFQCAAIAQEQDKKSMRQVSPAAIRTVSPPRAVIMSVTGCEPGDDARISRTIVIERRDTGASLESSKG